MQSEKVIRAMTPAVVIDQQQIIRKEFKEHFERARSSSIKALGPAGLPSIRESHRDNSLVPQVPTSQP
jgi:hypothetical protein